MINKPRFKACYHVEILDSDHVFLLREGASKVLTGAKYKLIARLIDGTRTVVDLAQMLDGKLSLPMIQYVLNQLEAHSCLAEGDAPDAAAAPRTIAAFDALGVDARTAMSRIAQAQVRVMAVGSADPAPLVSALERAGITAADNGGDLLIGVVDDYLHPSLAEINQEALITGQRWLPVKLVGTQSWIGPLIQPQQSACWECLAQRLRGNRQLETYLARKKPEAMPILTSRAMLPTTVQAAAQIAALEVMKWLIQAEAFSLERHVLTFDHLNIAVDRHPVTHRPQCPACGSPTLEAQPNLIHLSGDAALVDDTLRRIRPEDMLKRITPHVSPISGLINRLECSDAGANGLTYTCVAGHYFPLIKDSLHWLRFNLRSHTGGKGTSPLQAKVSAACEAIERYSTIYQGTEPTRRAAYRSLTECAIHPAEYQGFSDQQYTDRALWNQALPPNSYHVVPNPFDEALELDWSPVWSLTHQEFKVALSALCYYGHPEAERFFNTMDSSGVAAGSTLEEAILYGFMELVERDSAAIWWYNRIPRPTVDLDSFKLPYVASLRDYYRRLNRDLWVLDITADLGIPAFAALSRRIDCPVQDIIYGFGAHFSPQSALMAAITEMNQSLPAVIEHEDGITRYRWSQQDALDWCKTVTVENQPHLAPDPSMPLKHLSDYPPVPSLSQSDHVARCIEITRQAGLEMLALDLTRPDIGIPVCRVLVPGMRHFWRRMGAGRLYDVPVKLGWLTEPHREAAMNPYSVFI